MNGKIQIIRPQLVDAETVAEHLGFTATVIRRMARVGRIPSYAIQNGKRSYYRFHIEEVMESLRRGENETGVVSEGKHCSSKPAKDA